MSRFGNLKAGPDGRMTADDTACWAELIALAEAAASKSAEKPVPALAKISDQARHACAPGVVTRSNPCVQLSKLARRYCAETVAGRRGLQAELAEAAEAARGALDAGGGRPRKDLDQ